MSEQREHAEKALRRAWREFCEKVHKMGNVSMHATCREDTRGEGVLGFGFHADVRIEE